MQADKSQIDWSRLDKQKFFVVGAGLFTSLTTALYPLSVIKTRQMALAGSQGGLSGAVATARGVVAHDGVRGLYKGFGTVVLGMFPARMIYLSAMEVSKAASGAVLQRYNLGDTAAVGAASFIGGAMASLSSQLVVVPIDVVAQRLMLLGGPPPPGAGSADPQARAAAAAEAARRHHTSGLALARQIVAKEGVRGLYRGFGASLAMFVPNSAIWWGSYGVWQQVLWHQVDRVRGHHWHTEGEILGVQTVAGILTGCTTAVLTNPLDVVKTRLQTAGAAGAALGAGAPAAAAAAAAAPAAAVAGAGAAHDAAEAAASATAAAAQQQVARPPTWREVASHLVRTEGAAGFFRGVAPRMASSSIWGTVMVTAYEWLKRLCARDEPAAA